MTTGLYSVKSLHLCQLLNVVEVNNHCLSSDQHKTYNYTCGLNVELLHVRLVVRIVTTVLWIIISLLYKPLS